MTFGAYRQGLDIANRFSTYLATGLCNLLDFPWKKEIYNGGWRKDNMVWHFDSNNIVWTQLKKKEPCMRSCPTINTHLGAPSKVHPIINDHLDTSIAIKCFCVLSPHASFQLQEIHFCFWKELDNSTVICICRVP